MDVASQHTPDTLGCRNDQKWHARMTDVLNLQTSGGCAYRWCPATDLAPVLGFVGCMEALAAIVRLHAAVPVVVGAWSRQRQRVHGDCARVCAFGEASFASGPHTNISSLLSRDAHCMTTTVHPAKPGEQAQSQSQSRPAPGPRHSHMHEKPSVHL